MIVALNDRTIRNVGQSVAIGNKRFEVVKKCVYLGSLMTLTNDVSLEIQRRFQTANRCCFGLRKKIHHSQDLGSKGVWVLTKRKENQLLVFERKALKKWCLQEEVQPRTR
jgi:hypothetical protein